MKCEFDYCIYNRGFICTLKEVQLNSLGMCEECVIVSIPYDDLQIIKKEQLRYIKSIDEVEKKR